MPYLRDIDHHIYSCILPFLGSRIDIARYGYPESIYTFESFALLYKSSLLKLSNTFCHSSYAGFHCSSGSISDISLFALCTFVVERMYEYMSFPSILKFSPKLPLRSFYASSILPNCKYTFAVSKSTLVVSSDIPLES